MDQLDQQQNVVVLRGILRHYWRLKLPLDEAVANIRQTEGQDALSDEKARSWFAEFEAEKVGLNKMEEAGKEIDLLQSGQIQDEQSMQRSYFYVRMLPTETLVDIFAHLNPADLLRIEWVCSHWNSIVETHLWHKVCRINSHLYNPNQLRAISVRFGGQIRSLLFGQTPVPLQHVIAQTPALDRVRIMHADAKELEAIPQMLPNLKQADLELNNSNYVALATILHNCNQLNSLAISFPGRSSEHRTNMREFDLRLLVNSVPTRLKFLQAFECGLFLPHLLELAVRDCGEQLQVLITHLFYQTIFESAEIADSVVQFKNLRYLQIGIDLGMLKQCISTHPEAFAQLRGICCGHFDDGLISLLRKNCPNLEHLALCLLKSDVGRSTYRALAHNVRQLPKLRALDVRDTHAFSHQWRLKCATQLAQHSSNLEFLNLLVDLPFETFLMMVTKFKRLQRVNCFTIENFSLEPIANALEHRIEEENPLQIGIINKTAFENNFAMLPSSECIRFQKHALANHVEEEVKKITFD